MKKRGMSYLVIGGIVLSLLAGCSDSGSSAATVGGNSEGGNNQENVNTDGYHLVTNTWGSGAYPLDSIIHADRKVAELAGINLDVADNQFTADNIISDLQSQLANGPDGVIMMSVVDAVFGNVQSLCDSAGVPYVLDTGLPTNEEVFNSIKEDKLFIGAVSAGQYDIGVSMAETILEDGNTTAAVLAAAVGDYSHDQRILGFTETFEAAGGEVLQVMHCSDPSEATTKANDLITANMDVDCIYATGGDYLSALAAIKSADTTAEYKLYGTDVAPDLIDYIQSGVIQAMNGGNHVAGSISMCLLINYLDGHQILDENGKAPVIDFLSLYMITSENAASFQKLYDGESCFISDDEFKTLLYQFNPDVSYETFKAFAENYADMVYEKAEEVQ